MSRVAVTPIDPRDVRSVAAWNALYTAFEGADPTDAVNYAEEGMSRRAFFAHAHAERAFAPIDVTARSAATLAVVGAYTQLVVNGTAFRSPGPIVLAANEMLVVKGRVELAASKAAGLGLTGGSTFGLGVAWNDGGVTTNLVFSQMQRTTPVAANNQHARIKTIGYVRGPVTVAWIELRYILDVISAFPEGAKMTGMVYRRVT